ncbi:MAG: hypothetical protein J0H73_12740 [Salana multivorans]|uniref:hypothetical protein n=1 Tax=Salana multivorans TaxID=120377 RepID=UPI0009667C34|nr:hypothetical protein [Salana multivorans]MBN8883165.1 hypothetical protein [Salana multivorans]OJX98173.1 MAG: hypothetical protein BGO96_09875 [Micrococcales bacterium 73-15]
MTLLDDVLDQARRGATPTRTALALGVPRGLVDAALDHWLRVGVVSAGGACSGCAASQRPSGGSSGSSAGTTAAVGTVTVRSPACRGCPFGG